MTYDELSTNIKTQYFYRYQLGRVFPEESRQQINTQLWRWTKRGKLIRLKQGLYLFPDHDLDEFVLSALLYQPSYVSLESALNNFGLIPDIALTTTQKTGLF
jgi:predicted transcriptional regulator of viral defense system